MGHIVERHDAIGIATGSAACPFFRNRFFVLTDASGLGLIRGIILSVRRPGLLGYDESTDPYSVPISAPSNRNLAREVTIAV